jgi:hypothetical protein
MRFRFVVLASVIQACACSGSPPAASSAAEPELESAPSDEAPPAPAEGAGAEPGVEAGANGEPGEGREIKYIVTPQGLEVEVAGVHFLAAATAIKTGGGWGVRVSATAKSKDEKAHSLLSPKGGPIALAGNVKRGGTSERFSDKREGEDEKIIPANEPLEFSREWPAKGEKALRPGDELELEVGLWGLGDDAASRRPVRQFFNVRMLVGKQKPLPVVVPPQTE